MTGPAKANPAAVSLIAAIAAKNKRAAETLSLRSLRKVEKTLAALPWEQLIASRAEVVLDNVDAQLKRAAAGPVPKVLPKPSLGQAAYVPLPEPAPLAVRYGANTKLAWTPVPWVVEEGKPERPPSEAIERGEPVSFSVGDTWWYGAYVGSDTNGDAVIRVRTDEDCWARSTHWSNLRVLRPVESKTPNKAAKPVPLFRATVAGETPTEVSEPLRALILRALLIPAFQRHVCREYVEQLTLKGHHVFLTGGVVRDLIAALKANPQTTLPQALTPLDIATSASMDDIRTIARTITPTEKDAGMWASFFDEQQGTINIGGKAIGGFNARGLSITPLRSYGYMQPPRVREDGSVYHPVIFAHSLEEDSVARDFTMNALYVRVDLEHNVFSLTDPFAGQGVKDAEARMLRLVPEASLSSPSLLLRFWNFRRRGFGAEESTLATIAKASDVLRDQHPPRIAEILARTLFYECRAVEQVPSLIQQIGEAMTAGGAAEVFGAAVGTNKVREIVMRRVRDRLVQT